MDPAQIKKLADLARLEIGDEALAEVAQRITNVLALVDQLKAAKIADVEPMAHPLDALQRLRPDEVTEHDKREDFLAIAPESENGLYLVPKVIE